MNAQDLKNFYPPGTKDELSYYSTQIYSIELNATFIVFFLLPFSLAGKAKLRRLRFLS